MLSALTVSDGDVQLSNPIALDRDILLDADGQPRMIKNCVMNGDGVWLLLENMPLGGHDLLQLDFTGMTRTYRTTDITSIAPYRDGQLLVIVQADADKPALAAFDPQKDAAEILIQSLAQGADGLCYEAETNSACYAARGDIIIHNNMGKAKTVSYLPTAYLYRNPVILKTHLAAALGGGVFLRSLESGNRDKPTVRVYTWDEFSLRKVRSMLPDMRIEASDRLMTAVELGQAVLADAFPYDVVILESTNPQLYKLMEKGYLADLTSFPETSMAARRFYPAFLMPGTYRETLYALPTAVSISTFGYMPETLDKLGMTAEQLPRDILGVLDFLADWRADHGTHDGEVLPAHFLPRSGLTREMVTLYILGHQLNGLTLTFDTPLFRTMMDKIFALDDTYLSSLAGQMPKNQGDPDVVISNANLADLARNRNSPGRMVMKQTFPFSIGLMPEMEPVYPFRAECAAVLTRAMDPAAAARVVAAFAQSDWTQSMSPVLFHDYEPAISDNYLENREAVDAHGKQLAAQLKNASGAEKTNLEQAIGQQQKQRALLELDKFVATREEIDAYRRDILPYLRPLGSQLYENLDMQEDTSFLLLFRQLVDGQTDTEQFIQQAERILRMQRQEAQ